MNKERQHYFRCPYCGKEGSHNGRVSKSVGLFRIKELYNNVLIMQCQKCLGVCRVRKMGSTLRWADLNPEEKKSFQNKMLEEFRNNS